MLGLSQIHCVKFDVCCSDGQKSRAVHVEVKSKTPSRLFHKLYRNIEQSYTVYGIQANILSYITQVFRLCFIMSDTDWIC